VAIETQGELTAGETVGYREVPIRRSASKQSSSVNSEVGADYVPNTNVAVGVDAERFFQMFVGRLSGRKLFLTDRGQAARHGDIPGTK